MITHAKVSLALATLILTIAAAHTGIASGATPEEDLIAAASSGPPPSSGPGSTNVHEEYQNSSNKRAFHSRNGADPGARRDGRRRPVRQRCGRLAAQPGAARARGTSRRTGRWSARRCRSAPWAQLAALPTLRFAMPALAKVRVASQGDVVSQGDVSLGSNTVRATTGSGRQRRHGRRDVRQLSVQSRRRSCPARRPPRPRRTKRPRMFRRASKCSTTARVRAATKGVAWCSWCTMSRPALRRSFTRRSTASSTSPTAFSSCRKRAPT